MHLARVAPDWPVLEQSGAFLAHARVKKLPRAAECLVYSLTPSGVLAENHAKNRGFVGILRGQKCLKRRFYGDLPLESGLAARSMPRVFGRGSRSRPAALVSDRDDAALFPAPVSGAARRWRAPESRAGRAPTLLRRLAPAPRSAARWPQRTRSAYQASSIST